MASENLQRTLAAILFADAVGYSTLMGIDEVGTHERFKADIQNVVQPKIGLHQGRIVKKTGDGFLAIFSSVTAAVRCADEMRSELHRAGNDTVAKPHLTYRIGINMGDIIVEDDDVYGDAVNIAARIEGLAAPGGIALSGAAYWSVRHKSDLRFEKLGFLNLKNIAEPIEVYHVAGLVTEPRGTSPVPVSTGLAKSSPDNAVSVDDREAQPKIWSEGHNHHPSIIILPFENLNQDSTQDYFCDGLTSDLTGDLSKFANLCVISSNSAFSYRNQRPSPERLRQELGVEYMLEGSVQRLGDKVRVNTQLIETASKRHLWTNRVHGDIKELFDMQDDVVQRTVASLASKLGTIERERATRIETGPGNAYDMFLRGLHFINGFLGNDEAKDTLECAERYFKQAIELDQTYARAWGWQAYTLVQKWLSGWEDEGVLQTAEKMARTAVKLGPDDHDTHWALASVLSNSGKFDKARVEYQKALEINSNDADLHAEMSELLCYMGKHHEAIGQVRYAMHLNPHFPDWYRSILGWVFYFAREYDEGIAEIGKMVSPSDEEFLILAVNHARRAEALEGEGNHKAAEKDQRQARKNIDRFLRKRPDWTIEKQRGLTRFLDGEDLTHWLDGLRLAGLSET